MDIEGPSAFTDINQDGEGRGGATTEYFQKAGNSNPNFKRRFKYTEFSARMGEKMESRAHRVFEDMKKELKEKLRRNTSLVSSDSIGEGVDKMSSKLKYQSRLLLERLELYFIRNLKIKNRKGVVTKIRQVEEEARDPKYLNTRLDMIE